MNIFPSPSHAQVIRLLSEVGLPSADLTSEHLEGFFCCGSPEAPEGVVGLELYGPVALLRSLAVATAHRSKGCGKALVKQAEDHAQSQGAKEIYLLTTTAERYFAGLGYERAVRDAAPEAIRQTREFLELCPSSAVLMVRTIV